MIGFALRRAAAMLLALATLAAVAVTAGCGTYGPPIRAPRPESQASQAPAAAPAEDEAEEDRNRDEDEIRLDELEEQEFRE